MSAPSPKSSPSASTKALCLAIVSGNLTAAKAALESGADASFYCFPGRSLLMVAADNANFELFSMLIKAGADASYVAEPGRNVLTAALSGHSDKALNKAAYNIVKLLFELLSPSQRQPLLNEKYHSILQYAVNCNHGIKMCKLLIRNGAPVDALEHNGATVLHLLSANYTRPKLLSFFIKNKAPLNASLYSNNFTPLHSAVKIGNYKAVEQLLSAGADPNLVDKDGRSLLHMLADSTCSPAIISLAIAHGADLYVKDNYGRLAEEVSLSKGRSESYDCFRQHRQLEKLNQEVSGTKHQSRGRI
jgi:ankyrin repeat protein